MQMGLAALRQRLIKDFGSKGIFGQDNRNRLGSTKVIQAHKVRQDTLNLLLKAPGLPEELNNVDAFRNVA